MAKESACKGCLHYYGACKNNACCNYIFDIGYMRPCPPGEECTVKVRRKDIKRRGRRDKHVMELAEKNQQE